MNAIQNTQQVLQKRLTGVDPVQNATSSFKGKWTIFGDTTTNKNKNSKASKSLNTKDAALNPVRSSLAKTEITHALNTRHTTTQGASSGKFQSYGAFKKNDSAATGQNYNKRVVQAHQELQQFFAKFDG